MQFFKLCADNNLQAAKDLWEQGGVDINFIDPGGRTPIAFSSARGHLEVVNWLISLGANHELAGSEKMTALAQAASKGHIPVIDALLMAGANIHAKDRNERGVVSVAITAKQEAAAAHLIEIGADIYDVDSMGRMPLHHAAQLGFTNIVKILLEKGVSPGVLDKYRMTPRQLAETNRKHDIAAILLEAEQKQAQAQIQAQPKNATEAPQETETPPQTEALMHPPAGIPIDPEKTKKFFSVCASNNVQGAKDLYISGGVDLNYLDPGSRTPLMFACLKGFMETVNWLIAIGTPLEATNKNQRTALAYAAEGGHLPAAEALIKAGANIKVLDKDTRGVVSIAIMAKQPEMAAFLIEKGADIRSLDSMKRTPLHHAAQQGYANVVKLLTERNIPVGEADLYKTTPMEYAETGRFGEIIVLLRKAALMEEAIRLNPQTPPPDETPEEPPQEAVDFSPDAQILKEIPDIGTAVQHNHIHMVRYYIEQGADVNEVYYDYYNNGVETLFMSALKKADSKDICKLLMDAGVNIHERFRERVGTKQFMAELLYKIGFDPDDNEFYVQAHMQKFSRSEKVFEMIKKTFAENGMSLRKYLLPEEGRYITDYLMEAIDYCNTAVIKMLLEAGFNMGKPEINTNGNKCSPLRYYKKMRDIYRWNNKLDEMAALEPLLLDFDAKLDMKDISSFVNNNHKMPYSFYRDIVSKCADINEQNSSGETLLLSALRCYKLPEAARRPRGLSAPLALYNAKEVLPPGAKNDSDELSIDDMWIDAFLDADGVDVNLRDYQDNHPLYFACTNTTPRIVKKMLLEGADAEIRCGRDGEPLALVAFESKRFDIFDLLCAFGADVNAADNDGRTLLHAACNAQDPGAVEMLIAKGANVSATDKDGNTPLHILLYRSSNNLVSGRHERMYHEHLIQIADTLLAHGAELQALNYIMQSPLYIGVSNNAPLAIIKHLLSLGAGIDEQDASGATGLYRSVYNQRNELVRFLLDNGADANIPDNMGRTAYQLALELNNRSIISMIEKSGVTVKMDGDDADKAFMEACQNGRRGVAEMLMKSGNVDVTSTDNYGCTPLHYIARMGAMALAETVISKGADVNYTDNKGQTALHYAAGDQNKEMFKLLVSKGGDINITDDKGVSPVHLIANRGQHDLLEFLINNGADINTMTNTGLSLLHMACLTRSVESLRVLLKHGMSPDHMDRAGNSPLSLCARNNQKEMARLLLNAGANIRTRDVYGDECIHIATAQGFKDMLVILLDNGSDINALNDKGLSPLHLAAYYGYKDIFKFLLERGADFSLKTGAGRTCVEIASENGQKEIIELIGIMQRRNELNSPKSILEGKTEARENITTVEEIAPIVLKPREIRFPSAPKYRFAIDLPEYISPLPERYIKVKYPSENRPEVILSDRSTTVSMTFSVRLGAVPGLEKRITGYSSALFGVHDPSRIISEKIFEVESGLTVACFDARFTVVDDDIYYLFFITDLPSVPNAEIFGAFSCPFSKRGEYEPIFRRVMETLKPVECEKIEIIPNGTTTEAEIDYLETMFSMRIPEDYKTFLLNCNGGTPAVKDTRFYVTNLGRHMQLEVLFGIGIEGMDLSEWSFTYQDGDDQTLVIGKAPNGARILLTCKDDEDEDGIWYNDKDNVEGIEGGNTYFITETFTEFLQMLEQPPNAKMDMMVKSDVEKYRPLIEAFVEKTKIPAIVLTATESYDLNTTASKIGGVPYIPMGFEYPVGDDGEPLWLLAQLNFDELPQLENFPQSGILQFYISITDDIYGCNFDQNPDEQTNFRVIYHSDISLEEDPNDPPEPEDGDYPFEEEFRLTGVLSEHPMTGPYYKTMDLLKKFFDESGMDYQDDWDDIEDMADEFLGEDAHLISGYPYFTQQDPRDVGCLEEYDTLLLQVTSQREFTWGDSGVLNFHIPLENLKNLDFSKVLYNYDCY